MKKIFYSLMAAAAMLTVSCTKEVAEAPANEVVTFEVNLESVATRTATIGDASHCDQLVYEVYNKNGVKIDGLSKTVDTKFPATVTLNLAKGQTYSVAFWAQKKGTGFYNTADLKNIEVNYTGAPANDESRDAFYAYRTDISLSTLNRTVTLQRPFAQLNLAVSDLAEANNAGLFPATTSVVVASAKYLDLTTGAATVPTDVEMGPVTFADNTVTGGKLTLLDGSQYDWLSMNYILPVVDGDGKSRTTEDVTFTVGTNLDPIVLTSPATPIQRNWRTNIIAKLTDINSFEIVIDPRFENDIVLPDEPVVPDEETGTYEIENGRQLLWIAEQINGGETFAGQTIKLMNDIDMAGIEWTPINLWKNETETIAVIDGNYKKISNLTVKGAGELGLISKFASTAPLTIKNLTFENPDIMGTSSWVATVIGYQYGEVTMENVNVIGGRVGAVSNSKPIRNGGLVGQANEPMTLIGCAVEDVDFYGYHNIAGLVGTVAVDGIVTMTNCQSINNTFYHAADNVEAWQDFDASGYGEGKSTKVNCTTSGNQGIYAPVEGVIETPAGDYEISKASGLLWFAQQVNSGVTFAGKTVKLTDNIDLAGIDWTPIGTNADAANKFQGVFDGQDNTISNLTVKQGAAYHAAGLFGALNGTVQNLVIEKASVESLSANDLTSNGTAIVAGSIYNSGLIKKVTVKGSSVKGNRYVGGIAGYVYGVIEGCSVEDSQITAACDDLAGKWDNGDKVGGIAGYFPQDASNYIKDCSVKDIEVTGYRDLGGIVGYATGEVSGCRVLTGVYVTVDAAHNYKNYTQPAQYDAGSIVGEGTYTNCTGEATINTPEAVAAVYTAAELTALLTGLASEGGNQVVNIESDIILSEDWPSIHLSAYSGMKEFTINGNGHSISGLTSPLFNDGFAGNETSVVIKDLTIKNSDIEYQSNTTDAVGVFFGGFDSMHSIELNNCHAVDVTLTGAKYAGLVGYTSCDVNKFIDCSVKDCDFTSTGSAGAIVGQVGYGEVCNISNTIVTGCTITGETGRTDKSGIVAGSVNDMNVTITTKDTSGNTVLGTDDSDVICGRFVNGAAYTLTVNGTVYSAAGQTAPIK